KFVENQSIYSSSLPLQPPAQGFSSAPPAYPPSNVYPPSTTPSNDENQSIYSSSLPLQPPAQGPLYPPAYPPSNVYPPSTTPSYGCQFQQFSNPNRKQSSQYPPVLSTNAYPPLFRMPQHLQANSNVYPPPNYSNNYSSKFSNVYPPHPSSSSNFYPPNSTLSRPPQFFDSNRIQSPVSSQYLPVSSSTNAYPSPLPLPFQRSRLPETSQLTKSSRYRYQMENVDNNRTEDPRYNTQTYAFSLDHLNKAYNELINNRSII
ncbi:7478_t:CDS:2, partial [Rhizophagus irregularis]